MKTLKAGLVSMSVVYAILTCIYMPVYISSVRTDSSVIGTKIIATILLLALVGIALAGIILAVKLKADNMSKSKKVAGIVISYTLLGIGLLVILIGALIAGFFMLISE